MSEWWNGFYAGTIVPGLGLVVTLFKLWMERRDKRRESAAKDRAEAELKAIDRRSFSKAPYLAVSNRPFNMIDMDAAEPGKRFAFPPNNAHLLSFMREEISPDHPAGQLVILLVENQGQDAAELSIKLDGEPVLFKHVNSQEVHGLFAICYPFRPEKIDAVQTLELGFLRRDGVRDQQRYQTQHGQRVLVRVDPV